MEANSLRDLPSVEKAVASRVVEMPRGLAVQVVRAAIEDARRRISAGEEVDVDVMIDAALRDAARRKGVPILNASGVLLHTNLGRARWPKKAASAAMQAALNHGNVELDVETGERSRRGSYVTELITVLTGADDALVVNNNASALLLALSATASGRSVPVARGEMIEIGGSYRLPDVMAVSGARLVEVGTTNRVRASDYSVALQTHRCGAILKIHPSNYSIVGFTESVGVAELASIKDDAVLLHDIGSGLLDSNAVWIPSWLQEEPAATQSLADGADVVMFSGDKLLGGPQAGILAGSASAIGAMRKNPLARALRVDGVTLTALGATLEAYASDDPISIPFWRMALVSYEDMERRVQDIAHQTGASVEPGQTAVGAGSAPTVGIPTPVLRYEGGQAAYLRLLQLEQPVLARRDAGDLVVDIRPVDPASDPALIQALQECL